MSVQKLVELQFVHRANWDGTYDSICSRCFVTVKTAKWETDLEKAEKDHVCNPKMVQYYEQEIQSNRKLNQ